MNEPDRIGSTEKEHFNAAYRERPLLNLIVIVLYALVFLLAIGGIVALLFGEFVKGFAALVLAGVSFACWAVVHNWALGNPK